LLWLLHPDHREHVAGDLVEQYIHEIRPHSTRLGARLWLWRSLAVAGFFGTTSRISNGFRKLIGGAGAGRGERLVERRLRRARGGPGQLIGDLRYAARGLLAQPDFTIVAVITVALGISGSTAIFSVVNAVLLQPLPYAEPERLAILMQTGADGGSGPLSGPDFLDWNHRIESFDGMASFYTIDANLSDEGLPESTIGAQVSHDIFTVLGVPAALGRTFLAQEELPGRNDVAVISDGLWRRRFAADPGVLGTQILINGTAHEIVGVMPPGFDIPTLIWAHDRHDVYWPVSVDTLRENRGWRWLAVIGRLRADVDPAEALAEMQSVAEALARQYPATNANTGARLVSLRHEVIGGVDRPLLMLMGATGLVLLIVCGNVGGLLLVRATSRRAETTIRLALGASRARLVRQHLTESVLLSFIGGAAGFLLAVWGVGALVAIVPSGLPRASEIGVDSWALSFAVGLSFLAGIGFGLTPAFAASREDLAGTLRGGSHARYGRRRRRLRGAHVVAQVALALMLMNGAALMIVSYARVVSVDRGFDTDEVLTVGISLLDPKYDTAQKRASFLQKALSRIRALPGVEKAGAVSKLPLEGGSNTRVIVEGGEGTPDPADAPLVELSRALPGYLGAMGISLLQGRDLVDADLFSAQPSVVINRRMQQMLWPSESPIGKRISYENDPPEWLTIVGVVEDVRQWGLEYEPLPEIYIPYSLIPRAHMHLVVRSANEPSDLAAIVGREIRELDRDQPISEIRSMNDLLALDLGFRRFSTLLTCLFASVAVVLVGGGVYGVMSYYVSRGLHEIGVHMALGAGPWEVLRLVLRQGGRLALAGAAVGMAGAIASAQVTSSMVFGISPAHVPTLLVATGFVVLVTIAGALVPALKALRVDPCQALREE
jgi:putative ABC transport system permease protein